MEGTTMNRRAAIRSLSFAGGASLLASTPSVAGVLASRLDTGYAQAVTGTAPVKIRDIKAILTAPNRIRLVVVKIETTEPGLVGWGCATFTQRALVVQTALEQYLKPFLIGRNVDEIEDIWQSSYVSSYWRNGPVLYNAMSGVDIALWDIKAKRAGMPLYQLLGGKVLHDVHERVTLNQAINLCKSLEPYRLFFLEDPFPPEENDHFRLLRQQTSIPIAMGELFNTQHEYVPLIRERLIDFIRIHISQIGGLSPARKVTALSEFFGVRTAWHGPGDASPIAHAAQLALELSSYNFGVHEGSGFPKETQEVFVGCPEVKNGYMLAQEKPGHGIEVDE